MTRNDELGALWIKSGSKGEYLTGQINGVAVVAFKNDKKEPGSKQPDWRVLKAVKREDRAPVTAPDDEAPW